MHDWHPHWHSILPAYYHRASCEGRQAVRAEQVGPLWPVGIAAGGQPRTCTREFHGLWKMTFFFYKRSGVRIFHCFKGLHYLHLTFLSRYRPACCPHRASFVCNHIGLASRATARARRLFCKDEPSTLSRRIFVDRITYCREKWPDICLTSHSPRVL